MTTKTTTNPVADAQAHLDELKDFAHKTTNPATLRRLDEAMDSARRVLAILTAREARTAVDLRTAPTCDVRTAPTVDVRRKKDARFTVQCLECGKKFRVRVYANECPKCGGVDIDVPTGGAR